MQTSLKINLFIGIVCVALGSCTSYQYLGAGMHNQSHSYLAKPIVFPGDTNVVSAHYLTGGLGTGSLAEKQLEHVRNEKDDNFWGQLAFSRGVSSKNYSLGYGVFGYLGNYRVDESSFIDPRIEPDKQPTPSVPLVSPYAGTYNYWGWGARFSASFLKTTPKINWRVVGLELSYFREGGSLNDLRQRVPRLNYRSIGPLGGHEYIWLIARDSEVINAGIFTEVCVIYNDKSSLNVKIMFSRVFGDHQTLYSNIKLFSSQTLVLAYQKKRSVVFLQQNSFSSAQLGYSFAF
jgi:hypothetical protein